MKFKNVLSGILFLVLFVIANDVWAQCPMCKAALESGRKNGTQVGNTINYGIIYLFLLPYSIAMVFAVIFYRKNKQRKKQQSLNNNELSNEI